jgi:ABC-type multidrug transport system ATPase subunit
VANGRTKEIIAGAKGKKQLFLEIEGGDNIESKINELVGSENIKIFPPDVAQLAAEKRESSSTTVGRKIKMLINVDCKRELRPVIFNLAKDNNWLIWEMHQKETSLEDVFRELTQ